MAQRTQKEQKKNRKKEKPKKRKANWLTAATSDPHDLYERSVQEPEAEVEFIRQAWKEQRGRRPTVIREDFCGTGAASVAWVMNKPDHIAYGVDIDPTVLDWGRQRHASRLTPAQQKRLHLIEGDVLTARTPEKPECILAMNFSYFLFKTREALKTYFRTVYNNLTDDGLFLLDAYGGSESFTEMEEERDLDGFTYVWDQAKYNPITGEVLNHIHFRFPDGTEMTRAFTYDWRLWTLPEIQEVLKEVGFTKVSVYWEGTDESGQEGNGEFSPTTEGEACEGWIAYLVANK